MDVRLALGSFWIAGVLTIASSANASEIVLTAFEPFGGVPVNNSAEVVERLAVLLRGAATPGSVNVKECILPVEYDRAASTALDCIGERSPDLVLSFGAGSCDLRYETLAHNHDNTSSPDNAGVLRNRNTPIIAGEPQALEFNAPMGELYRYGRSGSLGKMSNDAGAYVCNNTAYWLAHRFATTNSPTRYGFIHVPPTTCARGKANPDMLAETVFRAIHAAMPELF